MRTTIMRTRAMTTPMSSLGSLAVGVGMLAMTVTTPPASAAALDGSTVLLCSVHTIMECEEGGQCERHTALQHPDFPTFLRINVRERMITDGTNTTNRKTEIKSSAHLDGHLILQGGENGRGWSATIAEDTGRMTAGVVDTDVAFALFGACTAP
jgi:hypothetical protein